MNRSVLLARAALVGLLVASGGLDHVNQEAVRLESRRAEIRALLDGDPGHIERVLAWARDAADVAEEAIRRIRMGWYLSESGTWEPPAPPPKSYGEREAAPMVDTPSPDTRPGWLKTREEARRVRQAQRNAARRGGAS